MSITYHTEVEQNSDEWMQLRCGILTASDVGKLVTAKTLKVAANDNSRALVLEKTAQRITNEIEPNYIGEDQIRGITLEPIAREYYAKLEPDVREVGFVTREFEWGILGCSPDGLVGDIGGWETKSPRQKGYIKAVLSGEVPDEYVMQVQTSLLVTGREWWDFSVFYSGLPLHTIRVYPEDRIQGAIKEAHKHFEASVSENLSKWKDVMDTNTRLVPTEKIIEAGISSAWA